MWLRERIVNRTGSSADPGWLPLRPAHLRLRRAFASILVAFAVVSGLAAISEDPPAMSAVLVARRSIPLGATLRADDLHQVSMLKVSVPPSAVVELTAALGQVTSNPLDPGELLTTTRLLTGILKPQAGEVLTAIRIADGALLRLVQPGQKVDLLAAAADSGQAKTLARRVTLLAALPDAAPAEEGGLGSFSGNGLPGGAAPAGPLDPAPQLGNPPPALVISVPPELAAELVQAARIGPLSVTIR